MTGKAAPSFIGTGSPDLDLGPDELRNILEQALLRVAPDARVLAIIPDKTRDDNTDVLFPLAAEILATRNIAQFDALVAQGTHMPMTEAEKFCRIRRWREILLSRSRRPGTHARDALAWGPGQH